MSLTVPNGVLFWNSFVSRNWPSTCNPSPGQVVSEVSDDLVLAIAPLLTIDPTLRYRVPLSGKPELIAKAGTPEVEALATVLGSTLCVESATRPTTVEAIQAALKRLKQPGAVQEVEIENQRLFVVTTDSLSEKTAQQLLKQFGAAIVLDSIFRVG